MNLILENIFLPLPDFALEVNLVLENQITGICGPSGAGKSSLLELVVGLRHAKRGRIALDGRTLMDVGRAVFVPPEQRRIGYVPQDHALFPHLDARANLFYSQRVTGNELNQETADHIIEVLELLPLLSRAISSLSGGEKQRVALGRALLAQPTLLLLDEPLSNLDDRLKQQIIRYLIAIRDEFHLPMLFVSHSESEVEALCHSVIRLERGKVVFN